MTFVHGVIKVASACTAVLALTTVLSAPVQAARPTLVSSDGVKETWTLRVSYRDLNLSSAAGRAALAKRVRIAARTVCGRVDPYGFGLYRNCARKAYRDAEPVMIAAIENAGGTQLASGDVP